jgi:protocatechuate 3,4-dioxygenase beta subunit
MNKNVLLKVLFSALVVLGFKAVSFAQLSPSGQVKVTAPGVISGCGRDTVFVEFTNTKGPTCPAPGAGGGNVTIVVDIPIPGDTLIKYQAASVGSLPAGAAEVSYVLATKKLTLTIPVPAFGSTTKAWFVVNASCAANQLKDLPFFKVNATYPVGYGVAPETWNSSKSNVGAPVLSNIFAANSYSTPNPTVPFGSSFGSGGHRITNNGYGNLSEVVFHMVTDTGLKNFNYAATGVQYYNIVGFNGATGNWPAVNNPTDPYVISTDPNYVYYRVGPSATGPYSSPLVSNVLVGGKEISTFTLKGNLLGPDGVLTVGESVIVYSYHTAPIYCATDKVVKKWVDYTCAYGGPMCNPVDTVFETYKISAGTPVISATNGTAEQYDGCPKKKGSFTWKNTAAVSTAPFGNQAFDVDLFLTFGQPVTLTNVKINGSPITIGTTPLLTTPAERYTLNIKDILTSAGGTGAGGLKDLDGDGKFDDLKPGDSVRIEYEYTPLMPLGCGSSLNYDFTGGATFTDYCRKLNGSSSSSYYKFGFNQEQAVIQKPATVSFGDLRASPQTTATRSFAWGYKFNQTNMDLTAATAELRINYGRGMQPNFNTLKLNGVPLANAGVQSGAGSLLPTAINGTILDRDSLVVYPLNATEIAALFNATADSIAYDITKINCDSFQSTNNRDYWEIVVKLKPGLCTDGSTPQTFSLSCQVPPIYSANLGCGVLPCYTMYDTIFRYSKRGSTSVTEVTPFVPSSSRGYEGDTMITKSNFQLSGDFPYPLEPLYFSDWETGSNKGLYFPFSLTWDNQNNYRGPAFPFLFSEGANVSYLKVTDTVSGQMYQVPIKLKHFTILQNTGVGGIATNRDNTVVPYANYENTPGSGENGYSEVYGGGGTWVMAPTTDGPYDPLLYTGNGGPFYYTFFSKGGKQATALTYLNLEEALYDGGVPALSIGFKKLKWELAMGWEANKDYPFKGIGSNFQFSTAVRRDGNKVYSVPGSTALGECSGPYRASGTIANKEYKVTNPNAVYSSDCGLTMCHALNFRSFGGDYFTAGEVRVPIKLDKITLNLPTEYSISSGTQTFQYHQGGTLNTANTAVANDVATGLVTFTSTPATAGAQGYTDFPRTDDQSGNTPAQDVYKLCFTVAKTSPNASIDNYKIPVKYYTRDEFGVATIFIDTITISEAKPEVRVTPIAKTLTIDDAGACQDFYVDYEVLNYTLYTAPNVYFAVKGTGATTIKKIVFAPGQDIKDTLSVSNYPTNGFYGKVGNLLPAEKRIVRVYMSATGCTDIVKVYTDFECNYPPINTDPTTAFPASLTRDTADAAYVSNTPSLITTPKMAILPIANLCGTQTVEVEMRDAKLSNLYNIKAGFKLPANATLVAGTMQVQIQGKENNVGTLPAAPFVAVGGTTGVVTSIGADSINVNLATNSILAMSCGLAGSDSSQRNYVRLKFNIEFNACPTETSSSLLYDFSGENYCGTKASAKGVVNLVYTGTSSVPNTYSCSSTSSAPLRICAKPGQTQRVTDSIAIKVLTGVATSGADSVLITIANDNTAFTTSSYTAAGFSAPLVGTTPEGRTTLKFAIPAGIAVGGTIIFPLSYNINVLTSSFCAPQGALPCADIAKSVEVYSTIKIDCPAKGLVCAALNTVSRGVGFAPRDLVCCAEIGNRVWEDLNADGVQDPGEPGIAGVKLLLYDALGSQPIIDPVTGLPAFVITDANGKYLFDTLLPGSYSVYIDRGASTAALDAPGFVLTQSNTPGDNGNPTNSDNTYNSPAYYGAVPVGGYNLVPGESDTTVDFGFYKPASIGNKVWIDANADGILDPGEAGLNGVKVYLYNAAGNIVDSTVTANDPITGLPGAYLFDTLKPGTYSVGFKYPPGYLPSPQTGTTDNNVDNNNDASAAPDANGVYKTAPVVLTSGENNMTVDAGVYLKAAIGDRVWMDNDKDGIQDATGEPGVAGVTVDLYQNGADGLPGTADDILVGTTVTDANGNYKFDNLAPSAGDPKKAYSVNFTPPSNYVFTQQTAGAGTDNQNNTNSDANPAFGPTFGRSGSVDLIGGEYDSTIDAGLILPTPATASVGNYVWLDTDKDGFQDTNEKGISGVTVSLIDATTGKVVATTITDADGKYLFQDVIPGAYKVQFTPPVGLIPTVSTGTVTDPSNSDASITGITAAFAVNAGDTIRTIDAGYYPQAPTKASLGNKVWYDADNDGIQDANETGVAGVTVNLLNAGGTIIGTTTTDALGNYIFNDLLPGTYSVEFVPSSLPAGVTFTGQNAGADDTVDGDENPTTGKTGTYTLAAGDKNMTVDAGVIGTNTNSIGDKVWYDVNKDGIQDAGEKGVGGVTVKLYNSAGVVVATTVTDPNGNYLFPNLPNGIYTVGFSNLPEGYGFSPSVGPVSNATNSDADPVTGRTKPINLTGGTNVVTADAGIFPKGSPTETASLGNKVFYDLDNDGIQDAGETGVAGVTVTLKDAGADGILGNGDDGPDRVTKTNALGEYIFTGLPAGNYAVEFKDLPAGYNASPKDAGTNDAVDSDGSPIVSGVSKTIVVPLAAGEENLTIDLGINKPNVNSIGNYVWIDANKDGIQDATEVPVAGVMATLLNADGTTYDKDPSTPGVQPYVTTTDSKGNYLFTDLPDGSYAVKFSNLPAGYTFTSKDATSDAKDSDADPVTGITAPVTVGPLNRLDTTVDAGIKTTTKAALGNYVWLDANLDGIQDPTEKGIAGVKVTVYNAAGQPVASTVTDADGKYFFPNLDPGVYTVGFENLPAGTVFSPTGAGTTATDSDVNPTTGRTAPVTLAAGDVNLTVDAGVGPKPTGGLGNYVWYDDNNNGIQDATEKGVPGVIATLKDAAGNTIASAVTDGSGFYNFPNLTPGTNAYNVTFSNLPPDYSFTQSTGPVTDALNSDANVVTGVTGNATVVAGQTNPNVDAGIVKPSAAIGDRVWLDTDKDGIQDLNEPGVGGVTVTLFDATGKVVGTTVTDAMGKYKFDKLLPGDYTVGFTPPANYTFTPTSSSADNQNNTNSDANPTVGPMFGKSGVINLSANEFDSTIDAGLILPTPTTASVGNYVWLDANGDGVQDPSEKGISGVLVTLKDGTGKVVATTITDANGKYLFDNVAPGTNYTVEFSQPVGYLPTANSGPLSSGTNSDMLPGTTKTAPFNVVAGDTIRYVDAGFKPQDPAKASLGNKVWYDADNDGIQDAGETGVAGVTVNLLNAGGTVIATTTTDALGNYIFNDLNPAVYAVEFVKATLPAGYVFTGQNQGADDGLDGDEDATTGRTGLYPLAAGEKNMSVDAGVINPANTNSIGDKVWLDANKDGVQDPTEPGVAGVTVKLYDALGNVVATTVTDGNGNYLFPGLPNGTYTVGFSNLPEGYGFSPTTGGTPTTNSDANPTTGKTPPIVLSGGTNVTNVDAGVYPKGVAGETASLGNKVFYDLDNDGIQDPGETGVAGVTVTLKDAGPDGILGNGDDGADKTTTTNALGEYIFTGLPAGNYAVEFSNLPAGYNASPKDAGTNDAVDSDGNPIVSGKSTTGVVALAAGEENLTVDLGINKPNVNSVGNYVWIDANSNGLQDATDVPVAGIMATLLNADGSTYDKDPSTPGVQPYVTTTDANGNYLFTDLPDGSYAVKFTNLPSGYVFTAKDVTAGGGTDATDSDADLVTGITAPVTVNATVGRTNLTLDAGIKSTTKAALGNYVWLDANLDGIQDPTEKGIAGVIVTVYDVSGKPVASTVTDADGKYFFPNLDPGVYTVGFENLPAGTVFSPTGAGTTATDSDVNPTTGRTAPVTLNAGDVNLTVDAGVGPKPTGGLGNYVWFDDNTNNAQDPTEKGAAGVTATLKDAMGNVIAVAITDANGYYNFPNLPVGNYTVTFTTLPLGYKFTKNFGPVTDGLNSDANDVTGVTASATVVNGQTNPNVDAGLILSTLALNPLTLTAVKASNTSALQFRTAPVATGSMFVIERSLDGVNFTSIGQVNGSTATSYNFVDMFPSLNVKNYYRIKLVDASGRATYSNIGFVKFTTGGKIEMYPVPAHTNLNIVFNEALIGKSVSVVMYNSKGQEVYKKLYSRASSTEVINVTGLRSGAYIVRILTNNEVVENRQILVIQ